jgi:hypothetical protein
LSVRMPDKRPVGGQGRTDECRVAHESMDAETHDRIGALAAEAVRRHLEALSQGDRDGARAPLFIAPGQEALIDQYVDAMARLAPFEVRACEPRKLQPFPRKMHGIAATVWVAVAVDCAAGARAAELIVWWYPDGDRCLLSTRPAQWLAD